MSLLSCVCYKSYFFILIYWIIEISVSLIKNIKESYFLLKNIDYENQFIDIISLNIADLLAGFLVLYSYCQFKHRTNNKIKTRIPLIYNPLKKNKKKIFSLLILICFLDLYSRSVYFIHSIISKEKGFKRFQMDWLVGLDIINRYLFSRIILRTKITKHHIFSIIITIIGYSINSIIDGFVADFEGIKKIIIYSFFILPRVIFFPLEDVINQILLSKDYLMPHILMFYRGIIEFIILLIVTIILIFTGKINFNFKEDNILIIIILRCFLIISYSIKAFFLMEIIYIFNLQYVSFLVVSESFGDFLYLVYLNFSEENKYYDNKYYFIFEIISLIIIIFGTLIYNEIIIINKSGLNDETKPNLLIKERRDFSIAIGKYVEPDSFEEENKDDFS